MDILTQKKLRDVLDYLKQEYDIKTNHTSNLSHLIDLQLDIILELKCDLLDKYMQFVENM